MQYWTQYWLAILIPILNLNIKPNIKPIIKHNIEPIMEHDIEPNIQPQGDNWRHNSWWFKPNDKNPLYILRPEMVFFSPRLSLGFLLTLFIQKLHHLHYLCKCVWNTSYIYLWLWDYHEQQSRTCRLGTILSLFIWYRQCIFIRGKNNIFMFMVLTIYSCSWCWQWILLLFNVHGINNRLNIYLAYKLFS